MPPSPAENAHASRATEEVPLNRANPSAMDIEWQGSPVPIFRGDPTRGDANAPVTIVEFGDLQCSFCARSNATLQALGKLYSPAQVRFVWKSYPLPFHDRARPAHEAAAAVHALGGDFWHFHDLAYSNQKALTEENFVLWAVASGVTESTFRNHRNDPEFANAVSEDISLGEQLHISGTPMYFVNGLLLDGAVPQADFVRLIDNQLLASQSLVKQGVSKKRLSLKLTADNFKATQLAKLAAQPPPDTRIWKIAVDDQDPRRGPQDALVTIVEWSDFQCPYCAQAHQTLEKILAAYPKDVRVIWKDHPLPSHRRAVPAALLARFAFRQGGNAAFWPLHDALFAHQANLNDATLQQLLTEQNLPWAQAQVAMKDDSLLPRLIASRDQAEDFSIRGTPHFFINGQRLMGAQPFEAFQALVDSRLALAKQAVEKGVARAQVYEHLMATALPAPLPEQKDVPAPDAQHAFRGPSRAPIVIQLFSDFQCPFCARVNPTLEALLKRYPQRVKVVWRNLPLPFHSHAQLAAEAAQEAFAQKGNAGFWQYHDLLFANQKALERQDLLRYASEMGLDTERFTRALDSRTHLAFVQADAQLAQQAAIGATPAFVINGFYLSGARPLHHFDKLIRRLLQPAKTQ